MIHEQQEALIRRKFALQVALGEMPYRALCEETSETLAARFDVSATYAGGCLRYEMGKRP